MGNGLEFDDKEASDVPQTARARLRGGGGAPWIWGRGRNLDLTATCGFRTLSPAPSSSCCWQQWMYVCVAFFVYAYRNLDVSLYSCMYINVHIVYAHNIKVRMLQAIVKVWKYQLWMRRFFKKNWAKMSSQVFQLKHLHHKLLDGFTPKLRAPFLKNTDILRSCVVAQKRLFWAIRR